MTVILLINLQIELFLIADSTTPRSDLWLLLTHAPSCRTWFFSATSHLSHLKVNQGSDLCACDQCPTRYFCYRFRCCNQNRRKHHQCLWVPFSHDLSTSTARMTSAIYFRVIRQLRNSDASTRFTVCTMMVVSTMLFALTVRFVWHKPTMLAMLFLLFLFVDAVYWAGVASKVPSGGAIMPTTSLFNCTLLRRF